LLFFGIVSHGLICPGEGCPKNMVLLKTPNFRSLLMIRRPYG